MHHREVCGTTVPESVFGNERDAVVDELFRLGPSEVGATDSKVAGSDIPDASCNLCKLLLPVPTDAGDTDDFALSDSQVDVREGFDTSVVVGADAAHLKDWVTETDSLLVDFEEYLAANHHLREVGLGYVGNGCRTDVFPLTEDSHPVDDRLDLVEFVRNENDGESLLGESLE